MFLLDLRFFVPLLSNADSSALNNMQQGVKSGFPLRIEAESVEVKEADFNPGTSLV